MIRLYWSGGNRSDINFGDSISPRIVEQLSGKKVVYANIDACDVAAIGSILNKIVTRQWKRMLRLRLDKIRIWGTGAFGPDDLLKGRSGLAIAAVRGVLTRDALKLDATAALGDPGLLVDRLAGPADKKFRWGIIPHVVDRKLGIIHDMHKNTDHSCIIDLADPDILGVAKKIRSCDFIISSSLHGLITADAFGIPNVWMRVSGNIFGGDWKFLDYFSTVDRTETAPLYPAETALNLGSLEDTAARVARQTVERRQNDLEKSFAQMGL